MDGQFVKEIFLSHKSGLKVEFLKGILFVSAKMTSDGSRLPIGPRKN